MSENIIIYQVNNKSMIRLSVTVVVNLDYYEEYYWRL